MQPFKVLIQDFLVSPENVNLFTQGLYESLNLFENEIHCARKRPQVNDDGADRQGSIYSSLDYMLLLASTSCNKRFTLAILVTDGVASGAQTSTQMMEKDYCRRMAQKMIQLTVIQVGSPCGFYPAVNFGHVPDNENLRYMAIATGGRFLYAGDCEYLTDEQKSNKELNFYHEQLLIGYLQLNTAVDENLWSNVHKCRTPRPIDTPMPFLTQMNQSSSAPQKIVQKSTDLGRFPWIVQSTPPAIGYLLYSLQQYTVLPQTLRSIISSRFMEGYLLHTVHFSRKETKPRIDIILSLPWLPYITLFYRIRCLSRSLADCLTGESTSAQMRPPKIEINLIAPPSFAVLLMNLHSLEQRTNLKLNNITMDSAQISSYAIVTRLQQYVKGLMESDELFGFISPFKSKVSPYLSTPHEVLYDNQFWSFVDKVIRSNAVSLPEMTIDLILRSTSTSKPLGLQRHSANGSGGTPEKHKRQVATIYLMDYLATWASFAVSKNVYIKITNKGFVHLRLEWSSSDFVVSCIISFHNIPWDEQDEIFRQIQDIAHVQHIVRDAVFYPIVVCKKPLRCISENARFLNSKKWEYESLDPHSLAAWICYKRIVSGFVLVSENEGRIRMYKESLVKSDMAVCSIFFNVCIRKNSVVCDLSVEPVFCARQEATGNYADMIFEDCYTELLSIEAEAIYREDKESVDRLFTFECLTNIEKFRDFHLQKNKEIEAINGDFNLAALVKESHLCSLEFIAPRSNESTGAEMSDTPYVAKPQANCLVVTRDQTFRCREKSPYGIFCRFLYNTMHDCMDYQLNSHQLFQSQISKLHSLFTTELATFFPYFSAPEGENEPLCFLKVDHSRVILIFLHGLIASAPDSSVFQITVLSCQELPVPLLSPSEKVSIPFSPLPVTDSQVVMSNNSRSLKDLNVKVEAHFGRDCKLTDSDLQAIRDILGKSLVRTVYACRLLDMNLDISIDSLVEHCETDTFKMDLTELARLSLALDQWYVLSVFVCSLYSDNIVLSDAIEKIFSAVFKRAVSQESYYVFDDELSKDRGLEQVLKYAESAFLVRPYILLVSQDGKMQRFDCFSSGSWLDFKRIQFVEGDEISLCFETFIVSKVSLSDSTVLSLTPDASENCSIAYKSKVFESVQEQIEKLVTQQVLMLLLKCPPERVKFDQVVELISVLTQKCGHFESLHNITSDMLGFDGAFVARIAPRYLQRQSVDESFILQFGQTVVPQMECFRVGDRMFLIRDLPESSHSESLQEGPAHFQSSGLGISIELQSTALPPPCKTPPDYWLILELQQNSEETTSFLKLHYFSRREPLQTIQTLQAVNEWIKRTVFRVNALFLLKKLNETRKASKLLIPATEEYPDLSDDESPDTDKEGGIPGEYQCPEQFSHAFHVHWRVRDTVALNHVMVSLQALALSNRKNMLVYSTGTFVFYIKFFTTEAASRDHREASSSIVAAARLNGEDASTERLSGIASPMTVSSPKKAATTTATANTPAIGPKSIESLILMKVYGVDAFSHSVAEGLINLVESKISSLVQASISTFLSRNVSIKLSSADIDFVIPTGRKPNHLEFIGVPETIGNIYLFLMCLKQNLLTILYPLASSATSNVLRNHYEATFGWTTTPPIGSPESQTYELKLGDLAFIYSAIGSRHSTALESLFGYGICSVCVALVDRKGKAVVELIERNVDSSCDNSIGNELDQKFDISELTAGYSLAIQVWIHGNINIDNVMTTLRSNVRNAIAEYFIEARLIQLNQAMSGLSCLEEKVDTVDYEPFRAAASTIEKCKGSGVSSVFAMESGIYAPSSIKRVLVDQMCSLLLTASPTLSIRRLWRKENVVGLNEDENSDPLIIAGLSCRDLDLNDSFTTPERRGTPTDVELSQSGAFPAGHFRKTSMGDSGSESSSTAGAKFRPKRGLSQIVTNNLRSSLEEIAIYPGMLDQSDFRLGRRNCFIRVEFNESQFYIQTYNLSRSLVERIFSQTVFALVWNSIRVKYLRKFCNMKRTLAVQGMLLIEGDARTVPSSYYGIHELATMTQFGQIQIRDDSSPELRSSVGSSSLQLEQNYLPDSDTFLRVGVEFLINYIWTLSAAANLTTESPSSAPLSIRTPRRSLMRNESNVDVSVEKYIDHGTEFVNMARMARVFHTAKYPLLFSHFSDDVIPRDAPRSTGVSDLDWYRDLLKEWSSLVTGYMAHLRFDVYTVQQPSAEDSMLGTCFKTNGDTTIKTDVQIFTKTFNDGVVVLQIGVDEVFACLNMFGYNWKEATTPSSVPKRSHEDFLRLTELVKRRVHFNSLCYDFHIRMFQNLIGENRNDNVLHDIIHLMSCFVKFNRQRAPYSRYHLVHQDIDSSDLDSLILMYIFNAPEKYGMTPFYYDGKIVACYLSTSSPTFHPSASAGQFKHTLVLYPKSEDELSVFIIMTDNGNIFPHETERSLLGESEEAEYVHGGYYLVDIIRNGVRVAEMVLERAAHSYSRDSIWRKMVASMKEGSEELQREEKKAIFEKAATKVRSVFNLDSSLKSLQHVEHWDVVFEKLSCDFDSMEYQVRDEHHLLLLNPLNEDYVIHLYYSQDKFDMYFGCREGIPDSVEYQHLDQVVLHISRVLFEIGIGN